jgi:hypothetical protein
MFHPRDLYESEPRDFTVRLPLSIAQLIALRSVDAETVALIWLLLEHGASLTVAGPTAPIPGAGKSTTLHALLQFLPEGSSVAYMSGKYETFTFTSLPDSRPTNTYALCNEISDHQTTYMWGAAARRYLTLPAQGYHIATTVHADTIDDVLHLYQHDLRLRVEDLRRLGLIINTGLMGHARSHHRRWLTTHFLRPHSDPNHPETITPLLLSRWNKSNDTFEHAEAPVLDELANWTGLAPHDLVAALQRRTDCLRELSKGEGTDMNRVYEAVREVRKQDVISAEKNSARHLSS